MVNHKTPSAGIEIEISCYKYIRIEYIEDHKILEIMEYLDDRYESLAITL